MNIKLRHAQSQIRVQSMIYKLYSPPPQNKSCWTMPKRQSSMASSNKNRYSLSREMGLKWTWTWFIQTTTVVRVLTSLALFRVWGGFSSETGGSFCVYVWMRGRWGNCRLLAEHTSQRQSTHHITVRGRWRGSGWLGRHVELEDESWDSNVFSWIV